MGGSRHFRGGLEIDQNNQLVNTADPTIVLARPSQIDLRAGKICFFVIKQPCTCFSVKDTYVTNKIFGTTLFRKGRPDWGEALPPLQSPLLPRPTQSGHPTGDHQHSGRDEEAGRPPVPGLPGAKVPGVQVHGHRRQLPLVRILLGNYTYCD